MGLQNSSSSGNSQSVNLVYNKELKRHEFILQKKTDDGYVDAARYDEVTGYLREIRVERHSRKDGSSEVLTMKIVLKDSKDDSNLWISAYFDGTTRSMLNCLASCEEFKLLRLTCRYWGKDGENKRARIFIDNGGKKHLGSTWMKFRKLNTRPTKKMKLLTAMIQQQMNFSFRLSRMILIQN